MAMGSDLLRTVGDGAQQRLLGVEYGGRGEGLYERRRRGAVDVPAGQHGDRRLLSFCDQLGFDGGAFLSKALCQVVVDGCDHVRCRKQDAQTILGIRLRQSNGVVHDVENKLLPRLLRRGCRYRFHGRRVGGGALCRTDAGEGCDQQYCREQQFQNR